jgi:hypothetical protein
MTKISLDAKKQTVTTLRWDAWVEEDKAYFEFYIPKSRVPEPWPSRIFVCIEPFSGDPSDFAQSPCDLDNLDNPIKVLVKPFREHLPPTVRYRQLGDKRDWQIGEPYIPFSLIPPDSHFLIIEVKWDLESKGFVDVPTYREDL